MSRRSGRSIKLPAPYLRRVWLDPSQVHDCEAYPFCLPIFPDDFELTFEAAITIIVGENGTGKSTILEGIAALAGYDDAGGGKGYMPVDHSEAREKMGGQLSKALRRSARVRGSDAGGVGEGGSTGARSLHRHCERSEAIQNLTAETLWIASLRSQ